MIKLKEVFSGHLSKNGSPLLLFDVDGTLKETNNKKYSQGFNPFLPALLYRLQTIGDVGINTDQSAQEFFKFKQQLDANLTLFQSSTTGEYFLEGGHIKIARGGSLESDLVILIEQEEIDEINQIFLLAKNFGLIESEWTAVQGLNTELQLPGHSEQGIATKAIYEKGPQITDPEYNGEYDATLLWLTKIAKYAQLLSKTTLVEAGNGTLRIVKKGVNKGTVLHTSNPSRIIYTGDQINELPAVKVVKDYGGIVVLPANAHPDLYKYSDFISTEPATDGIVQMFSQLVDI